MTRFEWNLDGFAYADLYVADRLPVLDRRFQSYLADAAQELAARFATYRGGAPLAATEESALLIDVARHLEDFLVVVFGVDRDRTELRARQERDDPVHAFKEKLVKPVLKQRRRTVTESFETLDDILWEKSGTAAPADPERALACLWLDAVDGGDAELIGLIEQWVFAAQHCAAGRQRVAGWVSFALPRKIIPLQLVTTRPEPEDPYGRVTGLPEHRRCRDGFALTDSRFDLRQAMDQVHYCVYCHDHEGDYCSKGMPDNERGGFRTNALGVELNGCPLEEKISEAHSLKRDGYTLAALSVIMIDNPLVPATGHRICNDCMKSCIYQKQSPVDVPQIETRILTDVLNWTWGFEIYHLLTRWNPLNRNRPYTRPHNGVSVLCVGTGPAGFNLSYHLLQAGFGVVAVDGLKIEPLPSAWVGSADSVPVPIRDISLLNESLEDRVTLGFGGVAEYGITVRWDKNFLKLIYLTLARHHYFRVYGGVRFGGTLTTEDAWTLGFDHVALATGAGKPTIVPIKNNLAHGIRQASDFLMALQLTGAAKMDSLTNLQVRMPAVVIGGGLSAIDTATEVQAYYIRQVEKLLVRYERLQDAAFWQELADEGERAMLEEFLNHGRQVRAVRAEAAANGVTPDFSTLLHRWGGVTVAYRRAMHQSPAYLRNHEEIEKALEEGIYYAEGLDPLEARLDGRGHVSALICRRLTGNEPDAPGQDEGLVELLARSVFIAAGTSPNTVYNREHPDSFEMNDKYFATYRAGDASGQWLPAASRGHVKSAEAGFFTSYSKDGRQVSVYGDNHPLFQGSVVKAMASAKRGAREIIRIYRDRLAAQTDPEKVLDWVRMIQRLDDALLPRIASVERLSDRLTRLTVRAPQAARNWQPGQIYRLQNFHARAPRLGDTVLQMEGMAIDGVDVDKVAGEIQLLVNTVGTSSRIAASLTVGEPVVLMGPTGTGLPMPQNSVVTVLGGHSAVTSSIDGSAAWRAAGNTVVFVGHFRDAERARSVQPMMEIISDQAIWILDEGPALMCVRPQDRCFVDGLDAYLAYCQTHAGAHRDWLSQTDTLIVSDAPQAMDCVAEALKGALKSLVKPGMTAVAAVNSPMQCMMKEVCAQCLCRHHDPDTKAPTGAVFTCFNHHQPLFRVDFANLKARQGQNSVQEQVANQWLSFLLRQAQAADGAVRDSRSPSGDVKSATEPAKALTS